MFVLIEIEVENMTEIKLVSEEEFEQNKKRLFERMENCLEEEPATRNFTKQDINWIDEKIDWKELKEYTKELMHQRQRMFFLSHAHDKIMGKPQLIFPTIQRIPLLRLVSRVIKEKIKGAEDERATQVFEYKFIDDKFDKRYDGKTEDTLALDFFVYRVVDNGKEHYVFSQKRLSEEHAEFYGMQINLDDLSDLSSNLKIRKISSIFLLKEHKPSIEVLDNEKLVIFTKELKEKFGWDMANFQDFIFTHPDGNIYDYSDDFNKLRIAQLLSSKYEGYPLHLLKLGPVGTGKTTEAEVLDHKFQEEQGILEAGSSRMKVLVPSFKEKPANLGYICNCNRVAIIDELMKMIQGVMDVSHQQSSVSAYLGELNMLLEQKRRTVGSGNDNSAVVKSTAKVCITSNPLAGLSNLSEHLKVIDPTTMSRLFVWVQDKEECDKIYNKNIRKSPEHSFNPPNNFSREVFCSCSSIRYKDSVRGKLDAFLTIYDSCQQFIVDFDKDRVKSISNDISKLCKDGLKDVWKARGLHHSILILDGLVKFRCLFMDYDAEFKVKEEDYQLLSKILMHACKSWERELIEQDWSNGL